MLFLHGTCTSKKGASMEALEALMLLSHPPAMGEGDTYLDQTKSS
jgi:hypothetical protein